MMHKIQFRSSFKQFTCVDVSDTGLVLKASVLVNVALKILFDIFYEIVLKINFKLTFY